MALALLLLTGRAQEKPVVLFKPHVFTAAPQDLGLQEEQSLSSRKGGRMEWPACPRAPHALSSVLLRVSGLSL